jgi:hypothetical protein
MRRLRTAVLVLAMATVAAGCGGGGGDDDATGSTPTTVAATTVPVPPTTAGSTVPPTNLTLRITDVRLVNSEESDNGMRVLLPAGVATASVTLTGLPTPNRVISVCQAKDLDSRLSTAACRTPANGEAVAVALGSVATGVEIVQVGVTGPGAGGSSAAIDEVTIRYAASSREVNARLPQVAGGEGGGAPAFALTPASSDGVYRATLGWTVIAVFGGTPTNGQVEAVQGGTVANQAQGSAAGVQLSGKVPAPGTDAAIRIRNAGASALVTPKLNALLP